MEQLIKIEELLDSKEDREVGRMLLKRYMEEMVPVDPDSFVIGRKYNILIGMHVDMKGFGIAGYRNLKFTGKVKYGEGKGFSMIVFKDDGVFVRSDYILQVRELPNYNYFTIGSI